MYEALINSGVFLIETIFGIYTLIVLLRFLFQLCKVDFYNPLSKFILSATNPIVIPTRKIIPGFFGIDFATLFLAWGLFIIKFSLIIAITGSIVKFGIPSLILVSTKELLSYILNIFFWSIMIVVVLSLVFSFSNNYSASHHPIFTAINQLVEPILGRIRRYIPKTGIFDLSPLVAIILIQIFMYLLNGIAYEISKKLLI